MNKKTIISLVVIIVLVWLGYMVLGGKSSSTVSNTSTSTPSGATANVALPAGVTKSTVDSALMTRLQGASVAASESSSRVALVNGKAQFNSDGVQGSIVLGDTAVAKTFGGVNYVVATLGVTTGGSTYQYAVLFTDTNGTLTDVSYDLIAKNITVSALRVDEVSGSLVVTVVSKDASGKAINKLLVIENGAFNPAKDINL